MAKELAKSYNPSEFEDRIYDFWLKGNYFHAEVDKDKKPYTIVMPPPNITGQLHMGHALDETLQDILIRWRRMQGYSALWLPGTDHASIATEAKIVEAMRKEGITKEDIGREEFLKRAWEWKRCTAEESQVSLKSSVQAVTGSVSALQWTRAVQRLLKKFLFAFIMTENLPRQPYGKLVSSLLYINFGCRG